MRYMRGWVSTSKAAGHATVVPSSAKYVSAETYFAAVTATGTSCAGGVHRLPSAEQMRCCSRLRRLQLREPRISSSRFAARGHGNLSVAEHTSVKRRQRARNHGSMGLNSGGLPLRLELNAPRATSLTRRPHLEVDGCRSPDAMI